MDKICSSLRRCGCSLKGQVIFIGVFGLVYDILYYLNTLVVSIKFIHKEGDNQQHYLYSAIDLLLFESYVCFNITFWIYLLYGTIKDTPRKSTFIFAWLLYCFAYFEATFIELYNMHYVYGWRSNELLLEELCVLGFTAFEMCIVYRYYKTVPKQNNIYSVQ